LVRKVRCFGIFCSKYSHNESRHPIIYSIYILLAQSFHVRWYIDINNTISLILIKQCHQPRPSSINRRLHKEILLQPLAFVVTVVCGGFKWLQSQARRWKQKRKSTGRNITDGWNSLIKRWLLFRHNDLHRQFTTTALSKS
jgi:hypothetical protein